MRTRKVIAIALALLLAVAMTVAAGGGGQQSSTTADGVTTITVWSNDAHNKALFDRLIEEFNNGEGARTGTRIHYTVFGGDWQTAMNMAMETDRGPDIMKSFTNAANFQAEGKFLPWTQIPGIQDLLEKSAPYHRNMASVFNGVPYSVVLYGWYSGFHYNKALLARTGLSVPRTWAEFEAAAIAIARLEPGRIYGYGIPLLWSPDFCHWVTEYMATPSVGHMYWNFTTGRYNFEAFTEYFEMLARVREAGAIFPGMESLTDDQMRAQFAAGNIGFIPGAGWNVGVFYEQFPFNPSDGWDYAPMPVQNLNQTYAVPVSAGASYYVNADVGRDSVKLSKIGAVIQLLCGDATQRLMFSEGYHIPLRADIAASAPPATRPQWTSFGQSAEPFGTVTMPTAPHDVIAVEGPDRAAVISQILTGQIPRSGIRAALTDLSARMNAAFDQAVQRDPTFNRDNYIDATFEARLRAGGR